MPTGGTARFASPLNVLDFIRLTSIVALDPATTRAIAPHAAALARAESLEGHARSALSRVAR
jgi:histidinol dehydrogenase